MRPRGDCTGDAARTINKGFERIAVNAFDPSKTAHHESTSSLTKSNALSPSVIMEWRRPHDLVLQPREASRNRHGTMMEHLRMEKPRTKGALDES